MSQPTLRLHPDDNIIVALKNLTAGQTVTTDDTTVTLAVDIPAKHKFAAKAFSVGDEIHMYGVTVGTATQAIPQGGRIHTSNITHATTKATIGDTTFTWTPPDVSRWQNATFQGYHRANGEVGTANYWIVVPLVFCENRNLATMKKALLKQLGYDQSNPYESYVSQLIQAHKTNADPTTIPPIPDTHFTTHSSPLTIPSRLFPNIDGVKFLSHTLGCAHTDTDAEALAGLLAGYVTHPNVAGATILSLGCQKTQISHIKAEIEKRDPGCSKPIHYFEQQKCASEKQMLSDALRDTFTGLVEANKLTRQPAPLSKLTLGVECGGSDGFSGISANPLLGVISDRLTALGGKVMLAEFPELCGAEQNLVDRSATPEVAARFLELMDAYSVDAAKVGSAFEHNPSPGNIADGLTTDAIKSCGAARKGGTSPVIDVLDYPEPVSKNGLSLLCTPGNDVESTTAMAGSGANLMIFTTGLGTPTGNPITPTLKVSTNTSLATRLPDIIDFDAGPIIEGTATPESLADNFLDIVIATASGTHQPHAVRLGQDDFIPWKRGVSL